MIDVVGGAVVHALPHVTFDENAPAPLPVRWDRGRGALKAQPLGVGFHAHRDKCVLELLLETQPACYRYLFDPWSSTTLRLLQRTLDHGCFLVQELDTDAVPVPVAASSAALQRIVDMLWHLRWSVPPSKPAAFLRDAAALLIDDIRRRPSPAQFAMEPQWQRAQFITAVVSDEHVCHE